MPYENSIPKFRVTGNVTQTLQDRVGGPVTTGPNFLFVEGHYSAHGYLNYWRSGANVTKRPDWRNAVKRPPDGPYVWKVVDAPLGVRLAYKVWSKRLQKFVWARDKVPTLKLVKTWITAPRDRKKTKGMDLLPNPLSYKANTLSYFGDKTLLLVTSGYGEYMKTFTAQGCLWAPWAPRISGWDPVGVNAENHMGRDVSHELMTLVAEADKKSRAKLYSKVKRQDVNLAQMLMERRQVAEMFLQLVKKLVGAFFALKRGQLEVAVRHLFPGSIQDVANAHLIVQYGIRPLLSDLEGISKTIIGYKDIVWDVKAKTRVELPRLKIAESRFRNVLVGEDEVHSFGFVDVTYKYRLKTNSASQNALRVFTELGFGNLNSLAWEALPWSFVIDWLIPIGNWLNDMDAFDNLEIVYASKTVFCKEYVEFRRRFGGSNSGWITSEGSCGFVNERVWCERTLLSEPPAQPRPELKDPVTKMHVANALALLVQMKRGL